MNARADIDLVLPCYNPPSGWEERVATHFREVERLFSRYVSTFLLSVMVRDGDTSRKRSTASGN
mgnify:CR=1 FL=1